jgi:hopanoid biosynthesis associated RND transporter like protein HpnN
MCTTVAGNRANASPNRKEPTALTSETRSRSQEPARRRAIRPSVIAEHMTALSVRHSWLVVVAALVLTIVGGYIAATRFAITTDTTQLVASGAEWQRQEIAYKKAFPQLASPILAVIQGQTADQTEAAASRLADALAQDAGGALKAAWRPDGGAFFDRQGLLLLPLGQVRSTVRQLLQQLPLLVPLSRDPTLRGMMRLLEQGADRGALAQIAKPAEALSGLFDRVLRGEPARLSWRELMSGKPAPAVERMRFVLVDPVLDYNALEPASRATTLIRKTAADLGLTPANGVTVRLTGAAPLADEEFASVREGAPLHLGMTIVAIGFILFFALRSGRIIAAVLATLLAGLVITVATGLLMVGRFNVISVAVTALFLGLGVDFGIQFAVRYRDERHKGESRDAALAAAARGVGWSLTLAAAALIAGFFSFLPTAFRGVSELGLIAGVGMVIAFVLSLTMLPALLRLLRAPPEPRSLETPALAAVDHWILAHRPLVIGATALVVLAGLPFLLQVRFDANLMHLRDPKAESVAAFLDLTREPQTNPNTITVLAPSLDAARQLVPKLRALPEVARVTTLSTFVPTDQTKKLALIRQSASRVRAIADKPQQPAPTDAETVEALRDAAEALTKAAGTKAGEANDAARRLALDLGRLADATPAVRSAAEAALTADLPTVLARLKALFTPSRVTVASLPPMLRADWLAADGRARIEVAPKGDANDNAVLERFDEAVRAVAPNAAGATISALESGQTIVQAFVIAGCLALGSIFIILTIALRRPFDVALTLGPLVIATLVTLETAQLIGMPLNFANIIALPLMLAVGVAFHIYYVIAWRNGVADMLASSLTRAVFFSSLTTGVAFGSLWLSNHPGTASMGKLLTISLVWTLIAAFVVVPAFLGPPRQARRPAV